MRTETIETTRQPAAATADRSAPEAATSGLYLLQFTGPIQTDWRNELEALGVDFLQYVPDDAFIVRMKNVPPGQVRRQPFVHWLGKYRPEHKLHKAVRDRSALTLGPTSELPVRILLADGANTADSAGAIGLLRNLRTGARLRMGAVVSGTVDPALIESLAGSEAVLWVEPLPRIKLFDEEASKIVGGDDGLRSTPTLTQQLGYDGSGVVVAVADSGLDTGDTATMHPDLAGRVDALFHYGSVFDAADEHSHGTHVAGIVAGSAATGETDDNGALYGLGVASGAHIVAQRIFDGAGGYTYPHTSFEPLTRDAVNAGADIGSNSWGEDNQGRYDLSAAEFDELVRDADSMTVGDQAYIIEFSAGNAGPGERTIGTPAVAKNVIATGASVNNRFDLPVPEFPIYDTGQETMADFSSRGPAEDGRIKPDIVAPGTWIASLRSFYANDDYAWWPISDNYMYQGGTSQAGPHASGAAAVFVQYYRDTHGGATPSPALVKAALINSAVDMDNGFDTAPIPNNDEGWGRIDLTDLIGSSVHSFLDQSVLLTNSQSFVTNIIVASSDTPLKITLTYTDVPGFPGAARALVNDLDLEVTGPDGRLYRGNQFLDGESIPDVPTADNINNVEGVHFASPLPGQYTVRIRARSVSQDARVDTAPVDQDFALVISSDALEAGGSLIFLDATAYRVPAQVRLNVIDPDQAGSASLSINLRSTTESVGENVVLLPANASGLFTGAVVTATGPAISDGALQLNHNDLITATYFDTSAGVSRAATARADLVAPVLSNVSSGNQFSRVVVSWTSDEPSTSIVRYSTNSSLNLEEASLARVTQHSITLTNLIPNATYHYAVYSVDAAGNIRTNDNGGSLFTFVAPEVSTILLVDDYFDEIFGEPPLSDYTAALNAVGFDYDVWVVANDGEPLEGDLSPYAAVIWRIDGFFNTWGATQQRAVSNYLNSGGAMMVASMELLTRLSESGGSNFVRNVLHVQSWLDDESGSTGASQIIGSPAEPVGGGIDVVLDYSNYEDLWFGLAGPDLSDTIQPANDAMPVFHNDASDVVGLRWPRVGEEAPGRLVFFSFPFDAVPLTGVGNNRIQLLRNVLSFLIPGAQGVGNVALNSTSFPLPANVVVEVADSDLASAGSLTVSAATDSDPSGISVELTETARAGVFRGSFRLIALTQTPGAGELRAANGNQIRVDYFDASRSSNVRASAAVDTIVPGISSVLAEPGYQDAFVSWETTEPTDSLVQFGESPLLGRTAYSGAFTDAHEVRLSGLLPSRTYFYRVVSRDPAGNTATDDNAGQLHTLVTLTPVRPPWADDMNSGSGAWTLFTSDDSQSEWTLGVPDNGWETSAQSPPSAWGCNIDGAPIDYTETFLISPAIDLTGVSSASLDFWHSYDFSGRSQWDIIETAQVYVLNETDGALTSLEFYDGFASSGWENESLSLNAFTGQVIYLVWGYQLLSFDNVPRPGWLVDDVAVSAVLLPSGTVTVSNSLSQATFTLTGPTTRNGSGFLTVVSNAPVGEYVASFGLVPFYSTPAPQTNLLTQGSAISFIGNYTFPDQNTNGISDLWEETFLGEVPLQHPPGTDTDGDGVTDEDEFIAGTIPTNSVSKLVATVQPMPDTPLRLDWPAVPGRSYRLLATSDFGDWEVEMDWRRSTGSTMSHQLSAGDAKFYRVEVRP